MFAETFCKEPFSATQQKLSAKTKQLSTQGLCPRFFSSNHNDVPIVRARIDDVLAPTFEHGPANEPNLADNH